MKQIVNQDVIIDKEYWIQRIHMWSTVDINLIKNPKKKFLYEQRKKTLEAYFNGKKVGLLSKDSDFSRREITRLVSKCFVPHPEGGIYGWRALLPGVHIKKYSRNISQNSRRRGQGGHSGAFTKLMEEYPSVKEVMMDLYFKRCSRNQIHETRIRYKTLHKKFLDLCRSAGIQQNEYPFNVKHLAGRSLHKYLNILAQNFLHQLVKSRHGKDAARALSTGTGQESRNQDLLPYQQVIFDGHRIDGVFTILCPNREGLPTEVIIDRPWLLVVMDAKSRAILSYHLCLRQEYSSRDVLTVFKKAIVPEEPIKIKIPGLKRHACGGIPNQVYSELKWAVWDEVALDNARANLAEIVRDRLFSIARCSINAGPVRTPERRAILERFFKTLEENGFHRLPNTTGSNPRDCRRSDPEKQALSYHLTLEEMEDLIEVLISNYNGEPHAGIDYRSPLEYLGYALHESGIIVKTVSENMRNDFSLLTYHEIREIKGNIGQGRRPYIQYAGVRYTSDLLSKSSNLIGLKISIHINMDDLRTVKAFFSDGQELGLLTATGGWGISKHNLETRRNVMALVYRKKLHYLTHDDPIEVYLNYTAEKSSKSKRARTDYKRVARDSGLTTPPQAPELTPTYPQLENTNILNDEEKMAFIEP